MSRKQLHPFPDWVLQPRLTKPWSCSLYQALAVHVTWSPLKVVMHRVVLCHPNLLRNTLGVIIQIQNPGHAYCFLPCAPSDWSYTVSKWVALLAVH